MKQHCNFPLLTTLLALLLLVPAATSATAQIPSDFSQLHKWLSDNIRAINDRNVDAPIVLDKSLADAEERVTVITVAKNDKSANFSTVTEAVNSIPENSNRRTIIWIGGGEYWEKITINRTTPFVTLYGDDKDMPRIVFNGTAAEYGTVYSATVAVESDYFMAVNIAFVNAAPMPKTSKTGEQAVAMRISGDKAAFHNCKFVGFQDTLCDDKGRHFFKDCYVRGTVDFIFGNGKSLYLNTTIESVAKGMGVITAQARERVTDDSGFTFIYCNITGIGNNTYLGRTWKQRPRVVFAYTYMGNIVNDQGWSTGKHPESKDTAYYGEYKCMGPGASSSGRVSYSKLLTDEEAKPFLTMTYIDGNKWLIPPPNFHGQERSPKT